MDWIGCSILMLFSGASGSRPRKASGPRRRVRFHERGRDNTRVFEAEANHVPLARLRLWRDVDNARCGTIPSVFSDGFGFGDYADWLLGTPPIFVMRPTARGTSPSRAREAFDLPSSLMYADAPMDTKDIEHLVSMFWPDARLKRFVEIRPADALPEQGVAGYTALIKGLFYFELLKLTA